MFPNNPRSKIYSNSELIIEKNEKKIVLLDGNVGYIGKIEGIFHAAIK